MSESRIATLAELCGVASEWHDISGTRHQVPEDSQRRLLQAMGVACDDGPRIEQSIAAIEAERWRRRLPPVVAGREGDASLRVPLTLPDDERDGRSLEWVLREEGGRVARGTFAPPDLQACERRSLDGTDWVAAELAIDPPVTTGYHRLELRTGPAEAPIAECLVVFAPARGYRPPEIDEGPGRFGLTAQLYSLRSQRNWGVGDFTDLIRLVELGAEHGAAFVGLNPLHAPTTGAQGDASPYSPSSRQFVNPVYVDVETIPEFDECEAAQELVADETFRARLQSLRAAELVDYRGVFAAKLDVLELLFATFCARHRDRDTERGRSFAAFRREHERVVDYARFEAVNEHVRAQDPNAWGWPAWPEALREGGSEAVAELVARLSDRVDFFVYLQWNAHRQLAAASERARALGMPIGLYADLALSARRGGADTWLDRELYMEGAHLGAPPDDFNVAGQDWGLPPLNPERLRAHEYRPFIETLRANMTLGGALRIDHVMSLLRCFLIPAGGVPADGAYVYYRFDELRAILALESRRNRCLVIGEDLGTVPDEVRTGLREIGALGYRVLIFEKEHAGAFKPPEAFEPEALTVISTHDLPTLVGFWQGADLEWRTALDLYPTPELREQQIITRAEDRAKLLVALERQSLTPPSVEGAELPIGTVMDTDLSRALHVYLARTASRLVGVQAEDLLGEREQANLPGTTVEHPNWRRRLSLDIESWPESERATALLAAMRAERPGTHAAPAPGPAPAQPPRRARIPRATYRVQLNGDFRFADLERIVPYLDALGVSDVYCSPFLKARPGSTHGYDIVDHGALNPEIGERADLERLGDALDARGMGQILDMVPNHMAVMGRDNAWWLDVLENGVASAYADFFDIEWRPLKHELRGKVLLPVLGDHYGNVLDEGELTLVFDAEHGTFAIEYYEHRFPVDPREYPRVLEPDLERLARRMPEGDPLLVQLQSLVTALGKLPERTRTDEAGRAERARDQRLHQSRLAELAAASPDIAQYVAECLRAFNGGEDYPADIGRLHELLEAQAYRLAYWRVASDEINYRRFFDVNELASLRMEVPEVFEATHALVLELVGAGRLQGLRIDHPDGLYDPRAYFRTLQQRAGAAFAEDDTAQASELALYLVAEKILAGGERLREDWPVHGTTGYEFANLVNRFLVDADGVDELEAVYDDFVGRRVAYAETLHRSKTLIMRTALASELNVLVAELDRLAEQDAHTRDFGLGGLRDALLETVACFPVYRTYIVDGALSEADEAAISEAVSRAKARSEAADTSVYEFLRDVLLNRSAIGRGEALRAHVARFGMQLQQYTSPVAAKGMEDTAFYRYARLVSLNEVGGTPETPSATAETLHAENAERLAKWPHSMLASSTHDTKRSEDVRARLHVLSEMPAEWRRHVEHWARVNAPLKRELGDGLRAPDADAEYFLYQTLVGAWPLGSLDEDAREGFAERMRAYLNKAAREAKVHTSWISIDADYEAALDAFTSAVLDPVAGAEFLEDFVPFQQRVARLGLYNALSQLVLKLTSPGVPDFYQGNELWRFDLVDPDNRRPVDFERRAELLEALRERTNRGEAAGLVSELMSGIDDGRVKLYATWRALELRRAHPRLFEHGDYRALDVRGEAAEHVCAFARSAGGATLVAAVLRRFTGLVGDDGRTFDAARLGDTVVELPLEPGRFHDWLADRPVELAAPEGPCFVRARDLFGALPVAVWIA